MMDGAIVMGAEAFGGTIDVTPEVTTVVLHGEADLAARAAFHDFLGQALETTTPRIDVDLAGLTLPRVRVPPQPAQRARGRRRNRIGTCA